MPDDDEAFVRALVQEVPSLRPAFEDHLASYDELLTHVFFGDVSRWAVSTNRAHPSAPDLDRLIRMLETARRTGSADTCELIDASFIENICGETDLLTRLLPTLADRYRTICGHGV